MPFKFSRPMTATCPKESFSKFKLPSNYRVKVDWIVVLFVGMFGCTFGNGGGVLFAILSPRLRSLVDREHSEA